jgi:hypothetical protein
MENEMMNNKLKRKEQGHLLIVFHIPFSRNYLKFHLLN